MKKCKHIGNVLFFFKYPCPISQEQAPKMVSSPSIQRRPFAMGSSKGGAPPKCTGGLAGAQPPPSAPARILYLHTISRVRGHQNGWSFRISRFTGLQHSLSFSTSRFTGPQNGCCCCFPLHFQFPSHLERLTNYTSYVFPISFISLS